MRPPGEAGTIRRQVWRSFRDGSLILPVVGRPSPFAISFDVVDEIAAETPVIRPVFGPGDALMFDERFLHRTSLGRFIMEDRWALECWFFAPSHHSTGYVPFLV